jgi:hypothetical protein
MNRRTAFMLIGMTLLGLAIAALPQRGFADGAAGAWDRQPLHRISRWDGGCDEPIQMEMTRRFALV